MPRRSSQRKRSPRRSTNRRSSRKRSSPRRSTNRRSSRKRSSPRRSTNRRSSRKRSSPRRSTNRRSSQKRRSPRGTPTISASSLTEGAKRKGRDGHFYRVEQNSTGKLFWRKCGKNSGGANCRFIGPARK